MYSTNHGWKTRDALWSPLQAYDGVLMHYGKLLKAYFHLLIFAVSDSARQKGRVNCDFESQDRDNQLAIVMMLPSPILLSNVREMWTKY